MLYLLEIEIKSRESVVLSVKFKLLHDVNLHRIICSLLIFHLHRSCAFGLVLMFRGVYVSGWLCVFNCMPIRTAISPQEGSVTAHS